MQRGSTEPLSAIQEEQHHMEGSQRQTKSHSETGARPETPEFTLAESDHLDGELSENDNEQD